MKHRVAGKKLNRSSNHRKALYKNLLIALITHGSITTTKTKAKAIQGQFDRLVAKAKKGSVNHRRQIDQSLNDSKVVNKLVDELAANTNRDSGFTKITPLTQRTGDNAQMARIEVLSEKPAKKVDSKVEVTSKKATKKE